MNRVTFEMLAKWIAKESGAKIIFDGTSKGACANVKTNEIFMPCDLKEQNILGALALLMHEACHLKISKVIPSDLVDGMVSRNVLNVMEDIRVDNRNFNVLYNIRDFYEKLIKEHVYDRADEIKKEDLLSRCMINAILGAENFQKLYKDQEAIDFSSKHNVDDLILDGRDAIESKNWDLVKKKIKKVLEIFKIKNDPPIPKELSLIGISGGEGEEKEGEGDGEGKRAQIEGDAVGKYLHPSSAWDKGEGIKGPSRDIIGEAAFEELTRSAFKELLCIKEKRMIFEGMKLNTDEIPSFFTGDVDQLFHDEDIIKVKKSKIAFCLDSSGSMQSTLLDNNQRTDVLVRTVRSIINILKELQETEGLNISYDVWAFDYNAEKLDINRWEKEYSCRGGGTNLLDSFLDVQADILKNQEIDGSKLVILVTDGEVGNHEIEELRNHIIKHGAEVRCMVIGVGANLTGAFVAKIAGDNNILGQEHADAVVMDCIRTMIE
jgi:hypothetical protein